MSWASLILEEANKLARKQTGYARACSVAALGMEPVVTIMVMWAFLAASAVSLGAAAVPAHTGYGVGAVKSLEEFGKTAGRRRRQSGSRRLRDGGD